MGDSVKKNNVTPGTGFNDTINLKNYSNVVSVS